MSHAIAPKELDKKASNDVPLRQRWLYARTTRDFDQVRVLGSKILQLVPTDIYVRRSLARLLLELGDEESALAHWAALCELDANDFEAAFHIARAMMAKGATIEKAASAAAPDSTASLRNNLETVLGRQHDAPDPKSVRHVAICGVSYCGSTLMDRLLGGLPGVASVGESHWLTKARVGQSYGPADYALEEPPQLVPCSVCGKRCNVLSGDFRRALSADHTNWYFQIAGRLGTRILVSADKNPPKLADNDPLLRFDALVMFKSPAQAWKSQLAKLPTGKEAAFYLDECRKYVEQWATSYDTFLNHFMPEGKVVFLNFSRFTCEPGESLNALCRALELPFSPSVLEETAPGHAIGGNSGTVQRLRRDDYAVAILQLSDPGLPVEQLQIIEQNEMVQQVYAALAAAAAAVMEGGGNTRTAPVGGSSSGSLAEAGNGAGTSSPPKIKDVHVPGVFGDFRETVEQRVEALRATKNEENHQTAAFFEYLLNQVDTAAYHRIQSRSTQNPDGMTKYLDPIYWFESKLRVARKLGLDKKPPLRIIDFGTGPGHFPVVARFFGHDVVGTDLPNVSGGVEKTGHFYDFLCEIYGVRRLSLAISPFEPLGDLGGPYDMATAFLAAFNVDKRKRPWSISHWQFFLASLRHEVMAENGTLFMMLDDRKLMEDSWKYLVSLADWSVERSKQVFISSLNEKTRG